MEWYYYVAIAAPLLLIIVGVIMYFLTKEEDDYETQLAKAEKVWSKEGAPLLDQYRNPVYNKRGKQVFKGLNPIERPPPKDGEPLLDKNNNPVYDGRGEQVFFKAPLPSPQPLPQKPAQVTPVPQMPTVSQQPMFQPAAQQPNFQPVAFPPTFNYPLAQQLPPELMMSIS